MSQMKVAVLTDIERPKVKIQQVAALVRKAGLEYSNRSADLAVVIGGDGVFSYYGRVKSIPLLFVGVRSGTATGSKAYLAEANLDELEDALLRIRDGRYAVKACRRLEVLLGGDKLGEVFTDVSLERGADSNCLRYKLVARGDGFSFTDFVISNGVVVCTSAGSTGYYSYPDKLRSGDGFDPRKSSVIERDKIGICHIVPTYTTRESSSRHPLRYTIPWGSEVRIQLMRAADARLHGVRRSRSGVRVTAEDVVTVRPSASTTRLVKLGAGL